MSMNMFLGLYGHLGLAYRINFQEINIDMFLDLDNFQVLLGK